MEEAQHQRGIGAIVNGHAQHRPKAETPLYGFDPAFHLRGHARLQGADRRELGAVFVTQRQVQPQVLQGQQSARRKFFRHARAYAGE